VRGVEELFRKKHGERFWAEVTWVPVIWGEEYQYCLESWVDISHRKEAEEETQQRLEEARTVSETAMAIARCQSISDVCRLIGERVHEMNHDSFVVVSLFDKDLNAITIREHFGFGRYMESIINIAGKDPRRLSLSPADVREEDRRLFTSGRLELIPSGIYGLLTGKVPKVACKAVERLLGVDEVYSVGFALEGTPYGGVIILKRKGRPLRQRFAIETLVNHAAVAVRRSYAEEALRDSEERFRGMAERSSDLVLLIDRTATATYASPSMERILGYHPDEVMGRNAAEFVAPEALPIMEKHLSRVLSG